jgi:hypothetical protein
MMSRRGVENRGAIFPSRLEDAAMHRLLTGCWAGKPTVNRGLYFAKYS